MVARFGQGFIRRYLQNIYNRMLMYSIYMIKPGKSTDKVGNNFVFKGCYLFKIGSERQGTHPGATDEDGWFPWPLAPTSLLVVPF